MKKFKWLHISAFTLAEILIVVGIIGVIAESTIPSLISDFQDKVVVTQLKKSFSILTQAFNEIKTESGELQEWCPKSVYTDYVAASACVIDLFAKHLKVLKNCGINSGCLSPDGYKLLYNGGPNADFDANYYNKMQLVDGSSLIFYAWPSNASGGIEYLVILVDVNGPKKPNRYGYDLFEFSVLATNYFPANVGPGYPRTIAPQSTNRTGDLSATADCDKDNDGGEGTGCASWAIYNGNLDYKYVNDLNWSTKTHK